MTAVFGITGWKNCGKTTLMERLVRELTDRGLVVSTVKHAHHAFDIDHEGTDSYRHRMAGAREVAIVSGYRWALMHELREEEEPDLADILPRLSPCDLVLIEGYKRERHPKIEVRRKEAVRGDPLFLQDDTIVAVAADHPVEGTALSVFDLNAVTDIADFIVRHLELKPARMPADEGV